MIMHGAIHFHLTAGIMVILFRKMVFVKTQRAPRCARKMGADHWIKKIGASPETLCCAIYLVLLDWDVRQNKSEAWQKGELFGRIFAKIGIPIAKKRILC